MPKEWLRRPKDEYTIEEKLVVTVIGQPGNTRVHHEFLASDLDLASVKTLSRGSTVDARMVGVSGAHIVMFDIGVDMVALAWRQEVSACKPGDILHGWKVTMFSPKHVWLGPPECELRDVKAMRSGQRFNACVDEVSKKFNAVYFHVNGQADLVGFERKGHLRKRAVDYEIGERVRVEIVEAMGLRVRAKDVGTWSVA